MMEPKILVRCLERDAKLVESVFDDCKKEYLKIVKDQLDKDEELDIELCKHTLQPRVLADCQSLPLEQIDDTWESKIRLERNVDEKIW